MDVRHGERWALYGIHRSEFELLNGSGSGEQTFVLFNCWAATLFTFYDILREIHTFEQQIVAVSVHLICFPSFHGALTAINQPRIAKYSRLTAKWTSLSLPHSYDGWSCI